MALTKIITPILLMALLAGCASAPPKYYSLDMRPHNTTAPGTAIQVDHITIADILASQNIFIQKSPTQIEYYAVDQWAANLSDLLQEKLSVELGEPTNTGDTLLLTGTLQAFGQKDTAWHKDTVTAASAIVKLHIQLRAPDASRNSPPLLDKTYTCEHPATEPGAPAIVEALSRCVESIATELRNDARQLQG